MLLGQVATQALLCFNLQLKHFAKIPTVSLYAQTAQNAELNLETFGYVLSTSAASFAKNYVFPT